MGRRRKTDSEKRETNKARFQRFQAKRVNIGKEIDRWVNLKGAVGAENDATLAKLLIDNYLEKHSMGTMVPPPTDPGLLSVTKGSDTFSCIKIEADDTMMEAGTSSLKNKETEETFIPMTAKNTELTEKDHLKVGETKTASYDVYKCGFQLAAIDYSKHIARKHV